MTTIAVISLKILVPVLFIAMGGGAWFVAKSLASRGARDVGVFTMALGAFGGALSLLFLIDYSGTKEMHAASLIASAIVLGSGAVVTAIAKSKE